MNYKALVEKYWAGETTIAEEKALKVYFSSNQVEQELLPYVSMFQYFEVTKKQTLAQPIESLLLIDNKRVINPVVRSKMYLIRRIAAAVLFLVIASIGYQKMQVPSKAERMEAYWASKEIKHPKEAFLKTKAALLLVSKKLNNGTEAALQQVAKVQQVGQFIKSPD